MRLWFVVEITRRIVLSSGLILGFWTLFTSAAFPVWATGFAAALLGYAFLPREAVPEGGKTMSFIPAIFGVDLASLIFIVPMALLTMFAEIDPGQPTALTISFITLPFFLLGIFLSYIAARNACFWWEGNSGGVTLASPMRRRELMSGDVKSIRDHTFRLPGWVWWVLTMFGGIRGAGITLMHKDRNSSYLKIDLSDGSKLTLPIDGYPEADKLRTFLARLAT